MPIPSRTFLSAAALAFAHLAHAQSPAPVPPQIASATTVFLSNLGSEQNDVSEGAYNAFAAGLQSWGKYKVVTNPADADLDLELEFATRPIEDVSGLPQPPRPSFRLIVLDRATRTPLWSVTEYVPLGRRTTLDREYTMVIGWLLNDLRSLAAGNQPAAAAKAAPATKKP